MQWDVRASRALMVQRVQNTAAIREHRDAVISLFRDGLPGNR